MGSNIESYSPENLGRLARSLSDLATTLERDLARIRSALLEAQGHPPSNGKSAMVIAKAHDDARDMLARARLAREIAYRETLEQLFAPLTGLSWPPGFARLDWATTSQSGFQARQDAQALQAALADKDTAAGRSELFLLARSLRAHLDDPDYLTTFWATAGPQAAGLARILHHQDGDSTTALTDQDKNILNAFGTSMAAAANKGVLTRQTQDSFTKTDDLWSAAMLLKFGPSGKDYGGKGAPFLAQMGRTVLDSRINDQKGHKNPWRSPAGSLTFNEEYEPTLAVLQRLGENNRAARLVTGDPQTGLKYVRELVSNQWVHGHSPRAQGVDYSHYAGNVLKAAAHHQRGTSEDAHLATQSVANMIRAANEFHSAKNEGATLPAGLRHAMTDIATAYIPDLAVSSPRADGDQPNFELTTAKQDGSSKAPWIATSTGDQIKVFLDETLVDPNDFGRFKGTVNAQFSSAVSVSIQAAKSGGGRNYLSRFATLRGIAYRVEADQNLSSAQAKDADAAEKKVFFSVLTAGFGSIPGNSVMDGTKAFISMAQPTMDGLFDTGHATRAVEQNETAARNLTYSMSVPVVQGLLDSGELKVEANTPGFRDGKVIPGTDFDIWYSLHETHEYAGQKLQDWVRDTQHGVESQTK